MFSLDMMILIVLIWYCMQSDDGGGMDPEAMRRCMSFGFSDKNSKFAIGQCTDCDILSAIIGVFSFIFNLNLI